jgi:hypothetical protein
MSQDERPVEINISGIPVAGVGGLGLVAIAVLVSVVMPAAWWLMVAGVAGGAILGVILVLKRHGLSTSGPSGSDPAILFRSASSESADHPAADRVPPDCELLTANG